MGENGLRKRDFLKAAMLGAIGGPVFAQDQDLFGIKVPKALMQFIPAKPLSIATTKPMPIEKGLQSRRYNAAKVRGCSPQKRQSTNLYCRDWWP